MRDPPLDEGSDHTNFSDVDDRAKNVTLLGVPGASLGTTKEGLAKDGYDCP